MEYRVFFTAAIFAAIFGTVVADEPEAKMTVPTRKEFSESFGKIHREKVEALEQKVKDAKSEKGAIGKKRKQQLIAAQNELAAAKKEQPSAPGLLTKVGSVGDPSGSLVINGQRFNRLYPKMRVKHVIDAQSAVVEYTYLLIGTAPGSNAAENEKIVILRGLTTSEMSDEAVIKMPDLVAVTGTEKLSSGQTLLVLEPLKD